MPPNDVLVESGCSHPRRNWLSRPAARRPREIAHAPPQTARLAAIDDILHAGRATGGLRADVTAEDIAASLIGIFTVAHPPEHDARASRLLNILMDGLRSTP